MHKKKIMSAFLTPRFKYICQFNLYCTSISTSLASQNLIYAQAILLFLFYIVTITSTMQILMVFRKASFKWKGWVLPEKSTNNRMAKQHPKWTLLYHSGGRKTITEQEKFISLMYSHDFRPKMIGEAHFECNRIQSKAKKMRLPQLAPIWI